MSADIYRCPVPGCSRKLARFDVVGDELVITPINRGRVSPHIHVRPLGDDDDEEVVVIECHRHYSGDSYPIPVDVLKHNHQCASVRIVTTDALERDAGS